MQDTQSGSDFLRQEINSSHSRLRAIKSGACLSQLVQQKSETYFTPDVDSYFTHRQRQERSKSTLRFPDTASKFFITETNVSNRFKSNKLTSRQSVNEKQSQDYVDTTRVAQTAQTSRLNLQSTLGVSSKARSLLKQKLLGSKPSTGTAQTSYRLPLRKPDTEATTRVNHYQYLHKERIHKKQMDSLAKSYRHLS